MLRPELARKEEGECGQQDLADSPWFSFSFSLVAALVPRAVSTLLSGSPKIHLTRGTPGPRKTYWGMPLSLLRKKKNGGGSEGSEKKKTGFLLRRLSYSS